MATSSQISPPDTRPWALSTLPPFPAVALKVLEELSKEEFEIRHVVRWIESDPAFTAELLRVANSALYGFSYQIQSVQHAAITLGADFVKALSMTVAMRTYLRTALRLPVLRRCWRHSVACAVLAAEVAPACAVPSDATYTAGLLHDIGRIGLLAAYPAEYANLLTVSAEHCFDLLNCEQDLFDVNHCMAGAWLARDWKLPEELVTIAARHHDPLPDDTSAMTAVRIACVMADTLDFCVLPSPGAVPFEELVARLPNPSRFQTPIEELKASVTQKIDSLN